MSILDLSIIIVNFNTKDLLINLLKSIGQSQLGEYRVETIVVDNNSFDGSPQAIKKLFPKTKVIINKQNFGFAKANNQGIKKAQGKYILCLNSDTVVMKETIQTMLDFMIKNKQVTAATCRVELANGKLDPACHRGFPTPWAAFTYFSGLEAIFPKIKIFSQYHQLHKNFKTIHEVDVISGAFLVVKKEILAKVGLFDERFFVYAEDVDLCYRLRKMGYKIFYNPQTKIIHFKTSSGRKKHKGNKITQEELQVKNEAKRHFFETMKLFYDKHYRHKYPWIVRQLVLWGIKVVSIYKD